MQSFDPIPFSLVDLTVGPTVGATVSGGLHVGKQVNIDLYGGGQAYANIRATVGVRVTGHDHGSVDLVGSLTSNVGIKGSVWAKGNVSALNWYFSGHLFDFDWTLFDKPWYPEEDSLGTIFKW